MTLEIKTDAELETRWAARRADRADDVFRQILRRFIEREGSVAVEDIVRAFPDRPRDAVLQRVAALDEKDVILAREGRIELAYPFSARPTPFAVILPGGGRRYACCAIDALGIPAMVGEPAALRSRCHHCDAPLAFAVGLDGPGPDADGIMVWVGARGASEARVVDSL